MRCSYYSLFTITYTVKDHMTAFLDLVKKSKSRIHRVIHKYHIGTFRGYAAHMNDK